MNFENEVGDCARDLELALTLEPDVASEDAATPCFDARLRSSRVKYGGVVPRLGPAWFD